MKYCLIGLFLSAYLSTGLTLADSRQPISKSIQSKSLSTSQSYTVWLPESYGQEEATAYPLLIILDGQKYGDLVSQVARFLARSGDIPEHVIVAINVKNRLLNYTPTDSSDWEGDGGASNFLKYVTDELLPIIENDFRLTKTRILWGHSAAGLFTMYALMNGSDSFNAYLVNDGSLDWDNQYIYNELKKYLLNQPPQKKFLYFNSSFLNPNVPEQFRFIEPIVDALSSNSNSKFRWIYKAMPTESHASIPLLGSVHGLKSLYEGYRIPENVIVRGLPEIKAYFDSVKDQIGAREKIPESVLIDTGLIQMQDNPEDAIPVFRYCILQYPESLSAREWLIEAHILNQQPEYAIKVLEQAINIAKAKHKERVDELIDKRKKLMERAR